MLRAFGIARDSLPSPWELVILGTGELQEQLEALAASERISENVRFAGYVENPYPALATAHVFVHSARWEGFGVAILEAAALGLPIVATDCPGGPREILGGEAGILVPPEDPVALANALLAVAREKRLQHQLALKASRRADFYAPAHIARRVLELAERLKR
jgi:glycosyltransferase involved in cell wall biosynthesis